MTSTEWYEVQRISKHVLHDEDCDICECCGRGCDCGSTVSWFIDDYWPPVKRVGVGDAMEVAEGLASTGDWVIVWRFDGREDYVGQLYWRSM